MPFTLSLGVVAGGAINSSSTISTNRASNDQRNKWPVIFKYWGTCGRVPKVYSSASYPPHILTHYFILCIRIPSRRWRRWTLPRVWLSRSCQNGRSVGIKFFDSFRLGRIIIQFYFPWFFSCRLPIWISTHSRTGSMPKFIPPRNKRCPSKPVSCGESSDISLQWNGGAANLVLHCPIALWICQISLSAPNCHPEISNSRYFPEYQSPP